jgi:O-antigen ligase
MADDVNGIARVRAPFSPGIALLVFASEFSWQAPGASDGRDWTQMLLKGLLFALLGAIGAARFASGRATARHVDLGFAALLAWAAVSAAQSPQVTISAVTALSSLAIFVYIASFRQSAMADPGFYLRSLFAGLVALIVASAAAFVLVPEQFGELTWTGLVRARGVVGHPNGLGKAAAMLLVVAILFAWPSLRGRLLGRIAVVALAVLGLTLLLLTYSRASIGTLFLVLAAAATVAALRSGVGRTLILGGAGVAAVAIAALVMGLVPGMSATADDVAYASALALSRSGRIEEIVTLTSRTHLWDYVVGKIAERPLLGHGYRAAEVIIPSEWSFGGATVVHAHSMYLEMAFSLGVIALAWFVWLLAKLVRENLRDVMRSGDPAARTRLSLALLIAVVGIVERGAVGSTTLFFVTLCVLISDTRMRQTMGSSWRVSFAPPAAPPRPDARQLPPPAPA